MEVKGNQYKTGPTHYTTPNWKYFHHS